jgi:hypothetical protein
MLPLERITSCTLQGSTSRLYPGQRTILCDGAPGRRMIRKYLTTGCKRNFTMQKKAGHTDSTMPEALGPLLARLGLQISQGQRNRMSRSLLSYPSWRIRATTSKRIAPITVTHDEQTKGWATHLGGDIRNGSRCDMCHAMNSRITRPSRLRLLINRTW